MRRLLALALVLFGLAAAPAAQAAVTVRIDLSTQRMTVSEDGKPTRVWAISSGRPGYRTPSGTYRPQRLARMHYSRTYDLAPMPHSIFFSGGYAIHGTGEVRRLGRTASHGCVRLSKAHAAELFRLVQAYGAERTRIEISGNAALADGPRRTTPALAAAAPRPSVARAVVADERAVVRVVDRPARAKRVVRRAAPAYYDHVYGYAPAPRLYVDPFWAPRGGSYR